MRMKQHSAALLNDHTKESSSLVYGTVVAIARLLNENAK